MTWWSRWRRFCSPSELRQLGVLGINARNARYVLPNNDRRRYPRVDDKRITKSICLENGIRVPETYAIVSRNGDIRDIDEVLCDRESFVIKPARGSGGRGIMVIAQRSEDGQAFQSPSGNGVMLDEIRHHLSTTLSGLYSLGGHLDAAIIEQRLTVHPVFDAISVGGTPDIRVILYRHEPVMAMTRLPTSASRGRANLHQGAAAAGINIATGVTLGGVCQNQAIDVHPDTSVRIDGVAIPHWNELLDQSVRLSRAIGLGYLGIDFVVDANGGPTVLEANARPGLAIQTANRAGLRHVLEKIDRMPA